MMAKGRYSNINYDEVSDLWWELPLVLPRPWSAQTETLNTKCFVLSFISIIAGTDLEILIFHFLGENIPAVNVSSDLCKLDKLTHSHPGSPMVSHGVPMTIVTMHSIGRDKSRDQLCSNQSPGSSCVVNI